MSSQRITVIVYLTLVMLIIALAFGSFPILEYQNDKQLFLGLTILDVTLLVFCPGASALGLAVASEVKKKEAADNLNDINSPLIGLALGLVVALYFIGSIQSNISSVARILALCILLGYQAPNIWHSQEKVLKKIIDKRLEEIKNK